MMKATSQNGLYFIFTQDDINLNLVRINAFEIKRVKRFSVKEKIESYVKENKLIIDHDKEPKKQVMLDEDLTERFTNEFDWIFDEQFKDLIIEINDNGDVGIRLRKLLK